MSEATPLADPPADIRRIVYLGTPELATPPLRALVAGGFEVALVVTRADRRRGRGSALSPSPVKAAALELGLPVSHVVADVLGVEADLGVVVAFGQIIRRPVLEHLAMVNLHFSLLPRWRGAAPVERALLAGDAETGVDLMRLEEGLDTGPIYARRRIPIAADDTLERLRGDLIAAGTDLLLGALTNGLGTPEPQIGEPTYAAKIDAAELELDWQRDPAELDRLVRLGGAWTTFRGKRLKVIGAHVADGRLEPDVVQPEGKGPMSFLAWCNGARPGPGEGFGS